MFGEFKRITPRVYNSRCVEFRETRMSIRPLWWVAAARGCICKSHHGREAVTYGGGARGGEDAWNFPEDVARENLLIGVNVYGFIKADEDNARVSETGLTIKEKKNERTVRFNHNNIMLNDFAKNFEVELVFRSDR